MSIIGALIAQAISFYTTLALVVFFNPPVTDLRGWGALVFIAMLLEVLLFVMKEQSFRPGPANKVIGVIGFVADGTINAGGLTGIAAGLLLFGPVALLLGGLEVNLADPGVNLVSVAMTSLAIGLILSVLPHVLWRNSRRVARRTA